MALSRLPFQFRDTVNGSMVEGADSRLLGCSSLKMLRRRVLLLNALLLFYQNSTIEKHWKNLSSVFLWSGPYFLLKWSFSSFYHYHLLILFHILLRSSVERSYFSTCLYCFPGSGFPVEALCGRAPSNRIQLKIARGKKRLGRSRLKHFISRFSFFFLLPSSAKLSHHFTWLNPF